MQKELGPTLQKANVAPGPVACPSPSPGLVSECRVTSLTRRHPRRTGVLPLRPARRLVELL
jgi:hypothetical protein